MEFEWDETKAAVNLQKHGISFTAAIKVFNDPNRLEEDTTRAEYGEQRGKVIGMLDNVLIVAVIYTPRDEKIRIISARRARRNERTRYHQSQAAA